MGAEQGKQNPEAVLSTITTTINRHLLAPSSFLPRSAHRKLTELLNGGFHLLSEDEYVALRTPPFVYVKFPEKIKQVRESAQQGLPVYIPAVPGRPEGVYMTAPLLENGMDHDNKFPLKGLLEECAHAFHQTKIVPVTELSDDSIKMLPWKDKDELYEAIRNQRQRLFDVDEPVDPATIRAVITGFRTEYFDTTTEGGWTSILSSNIQVYSEEARALIIQHIFAAKVIGSLLRPFGDTRAQLLAGYEHVRNPKNLPSRYQLSYGGAPIMQRYIGKGDVVEKSKELLSQLYTMDSDEFVEHTSTDVYKMFMTLSTFISDHKGQITG